MVLNDYGDGDILVCRITSQIYNSNNDVYIEDWKESGLKLPSVVRVHKIATLERDIVEIVMGRIDDSLKPKIKSIFASLPE
jgi:mRNA interferase MazF